MEASERNVVGMREVPKDGFCISAFLVISDPANSRRVLMGKIDPKEEWDHFGSILPEMKDAFSVGWMLPSSHIMLFESPDDAARRILKEQLGIDSSPLELSPPKIVSEVYQSKRNLAYHNHWDLEIIYRGKVLPDAFKNPGIWKELEFIDLDKVRKSDFARAHDDILSFVGLNVKE
jgi:8-oxo-dGTP pyrophosphatase MutT (NUDIX family)